MKYKLSIKTFAAGIGLEDKFGVNFDEPPIIECDMGFVKIAFPNGNKIWLNSSQIMNISLETKNA